MTFGRIDFGRIDQLPLTMPYGIAKYVDISMKLVSNQAVKSHRRRKSKEVQRKICLAWEKYDNGTIDAMLLIEEVSHFMAFNAPNDEAQELRLQL